MVLKILTKVCQYDTSYLSFDQNTKWLVTFCEQCILAFHTFCEESCAWCLLNTWTDNMNEPNQLQLVFLLTYLSPDNHRDHRFTLLTLIDGNMFWNMVVMSLNGSSSLLKLLSTRRGWCRNWDAYMLGLFRADTTSLANEYWEKINIITETIEVINMLCNIFILDL